MLKKIHLLAIGGLLLSFTALANIDLSVKHEGSKEVGLYQKYQAQFISIGTAFKNPFDTSVVTVDALITKPDGKVVTVPMFVQQATGTTTSWGLHFAPRQLGRYQYTVQLIHQGNTVQSRPLVFNVIASNEQGFLHQDSNKGSWVYDNGQRFRGVGLNIAWEARLSIGDDPKHSYAYLLAQMKENKVNLVRTWVNAPWNIPLEWAKPNFGRYSPYTGPGLHPQGIDRFDYLIKHAEKNDVNLMLTMDYHGALWSQDFDNWGNDHWKNHPYNSKNGGPAKTPEEFFTHPQAIARYQDRLRYIIARWGYSTRIAAIEFWNEIDNAVFKDGQNISEQAVTHWHKIMSDYLSEIDPYQHIQTTSISHHEIAGLFALKGLDFSQSHLYGRSSGEMEEVVEQFSQRYQKSYVVGETAIGWDGVNNRIDDYALALHEQLWILMFQNTPILPMTWWWEAYDKHNKFFHLKYAAEFISKLTGTDDLYRNKPLVTVTEGMIHRALYNNQIQYIWLKNTTKTNQDAVVSISATTDNPLTGQYQLSLYDTWTGTTKTLGKVAVESGKVVATIKQLNAQRDVVVILEK